MLISAREAVRRLGVKPATLYAYVSRGLIRSTVTPGSRERSYYAVDVERLKRGRRKGRRAGTPPPSYDSFAPVLDTSLCLIEDGRLHYRGIDAIELAEKANLEDVAAILWGIGKPTSLPPKPSLPVDFPTWLGELSSDTTPLERAMSILVCMATDDVAAFDTSPPVVARVGQRLIWALAASLTRKLPGALPVHEQLARAWRLDAAGADLIRRCLVLSADHELNPSTYVARCVASTGATPYAIVLAALCSFSGPRHGGHSHKVEEMLGELVGAKDVKAGLRERWRRGERLPGFGHPLYPNGDPRAHAILDAIRRHLPKRQVDRIFKIADEEFALSGRAPQVDYGLAATSVLLGLPRGSAQGLLLVGRTVGWIAHAIEQYTAGVIIRPRARYVGALPVG